MAPKLDLARAKARAENDVCATLYGEYGDAAKAAAAKGVAPSKDPAATKALKDLNTQFRNFEKSVKELKDELNKTPINGPDAQKAKEAQTDLDLYEKVGLVVYKRAEDYWTKKYPVKKK